jgi:O-antigen/teichoic acid export membrane protein
MIASEIIKIKKKVLLNSFFYFTKFATGQFFLQFINILNGFFLLRWLSISEQAKFSVAFSIQSFVLSLSDLGFTSSILALVGTRVSDKKVVGSYIMVAKRLRGYLFIVSSLVTLILLPLIIHKQSWSYFELATIFLPVLLAVYWQANISLYDSTLVMHKKVVELYKPQIFFAACKFTINYFLFALGYIGAISTLILNAVVIFFTGNAFKKKAQPYIEISNSKYEIEFKEMVNYLKPLFPNLVFNAFYGQIQIFLISLFGKTNNIAEVAALGKLAQIFLFLGSINSVIVAPFIAKSSMETLVKKYFFVVLISIFIALFIFLSSIFFPNFYLFLLGQKYYYLKNELSLIMSNACLAYIGGVLWTMHSARKWVFWWGTFLYISTIISTQIFGFFWFDIGTTHGILLLGFITQVGIILVHCIYGLIGFRKDSRVVKDLN